MDQLGCKRYCCRRMVMTHVDLIEKLLKSVLKYPTAKFACGQVNLSKAQADHAARYNPAERDTRKLAMD